MEELLRELGLSERWQDACSDAGLVHVEDLLKLGAPSPSGAGKRERLHEQVSREHAGHRIVTELDALGVTCEDAKAIAQLATSPRPSGASGGVWSERFLLACRPAHDAHMGAENIGPLLYALCRFVKPRRVLEVGAGYTSLWLLQALADNSAELQRCRQSLQTDGHLVSGCAWLLPWVEGKGRDGAAAGDQAASQSQAGATALPFETAPMPPTAPAVASTATRDTPVSMDSTRSTVPPEAEPLSVPMLHCVDDMSHANTTACDVHTAAVRLGLSSHLRLHAIDAFELAEQWPHLDEGAGMQQLDMLWLDFGAGVAGRLDEFLRRWWPRLRPGGLLLLHSTLTNAVTREWLETLRKRDGHTSRSDCNDTTREPDGRGPFYGDDMVEMMSLLEPHKRVQNSVSLFQKRPRGWGEPIHTLYP